MSERRAAPDFSAGTTPHAERYVLEADSLRRRQLRSALLHGRRRTWREHATVWQAVVVGVIVAAVILAALALRGAITKQKSTSSTSSGGPVVALVRPAT